MKLNIKPTVKHFGRSLQVQSPTILSGLAVVGVAATGYLTFKATWRSAQVIGDKETMERVHGELKERTPSEKALLVWKLYIPAVGVGALTIAGIVASNRIAVSRLAAMAAAYGVLSGDFDEYRGKAIELLGEKKGTAIDHQIAEKKMAKNPPPQGIFIEDGQAWFCDLSTMHYFKSDRQHVEQAVNNLNYSLLHGGDSYASLNNAYAFLGLPSTSVGDQLGWTAEQQVEFTPTPVLMPDGSSATGIKFTPEPAPDFDSLH